MKYFFASDIHLGLDYRNGGAACREQVFIEWLEMVEKELTDFPEKGGLFLLGDVFDFWYEYKRVVPKGFVRVLGKLARMSDQGIDIHIFTGNHDIWMFGYFEEELGLHIHRQPETVTLGGKRFFLAHGHGMGNKDWKFFLMNSVFQSKGAQWLFSRLIHPDAALKLGQKWSHRSRHSKYLTHTFKEENEPAVQFARQYLKTQPIDYFVMGHLHTPVIYPLQEDSQLVILGEWVEKPVYGLFDGRQFTLREFQPEN